MRIDPNGPHELIYSLANEGMGFTMQAYIFQIGENGKLTLQFQRITPSNLSDFPNFNTPQHQKILDIIEELSPSTITKKFAEKPEKPTEFLKKFLATDIGEKFIIPYCQLRLVKILELLRGNIVYLKSRDNPVDYQLKIEKQPSDIIFNFERTGNGTRYFPHVFHNKTYVNLAECTCTLLANENAWIRVGKSIYHFSGDIEGKKLTPFFEKPYVDIPKTAEKTYFQKFVKQIAEKHEVVFKGVDTKTITDNPHFIGIVTNSDKHRIIIKAKYAENTVDIDSKKPRLISIKNKGTDFEAISYERNWTYETAFIVFLQSIGLKYVKNSRFEIEESESLIEVLNNHFEELQNYHCSISLVDFERDLLLAKPTFQLQINEVKDADWFDIKTTIFFGTFEVPFIRLRKNILDKNPYFKLPNGQFALIPEEWFAEFRYLFAFAEKHGDQLVLKKQFSNLIEESKGLTLPKSLSLSGNAEASVRISKRLEKILRPYQIEGFNWLVKIKDAGFSGVLADDMGLGKTLQTIALLEGLYENDIGNKKQIDLFSYTSEGNRPSLVVVPSSLMFNWAAELKKFASGLKFYIHYGQNRINDSILLNKYHIVITTYGLIRNDIDLLTKAQWYYVILDESQSIKNPLAKTTKSVGQIKAKHRLALTGTPIENSLSDLWSQMNFLNKGLLGSYTFFKSEFVTPIEKNFNVEQKEKLKKLVFPFILRRTKEEVAKELPPLTEQILYCDMGVEQRKLYEKVKSQYRNYLLDTAAFDPKNRFLILKGLTELRLIANHPKMYDAESVDSSGKFDEIVERLLEVHEAHHKILVFSQFTRHLKLFKNYLEGKKIKFSMLTGATGNRKDAVEGFTEDKNCNIFLISLKAGGVGLNLTKADYVFLLDPWWNPFAEKQAIDRAYRIGQKNNVFSYKFVTKDSIEEKILTLQERKRTLAGEFIPIGSKAFDFDNNDLKELFS